MLAPLGFPGRPHPLVGLQGGWRAWVTNHSPINMDSKNANTNPSTAKKRPRPASEHDTDSENETLPVPTHIVQDNWPSFLIMDSPNIDDLKKLSPFAVCKGFQGLVGDPKTTKLLRSGQYLIEAKSAIQSRQLLGIKSFVNIPVTVSPHCSLNSCKGVIRSPSMKYATDEEILQGFQDQHVSAVNRIKYRKDGKLLDTNTIVLTFDKPTFPLQVRAGYLQLSVEPYIPAPLRCYKCQKFGHHRNSCRGSDRCGRCAGEGHDSANCTLPLKCVNCSGTHSSFSKDCPQWLLEKQIQKLKITNKITYPEARRLVTATPATNTGTNLPQTFAQVTTASYRSCGQQATSAPLDKALQTVKAYTTSSTQTFCSTNDASTQTIAAPDQGTRPMKDPSVEKEHFTKQTDKPRDSSSGSSRSSSKSSSTIKPLMDSHSKSGKPKLASYSDRPSKGSHDTLHDYTMDTDCAYDPDEGNYHHGSHSKKGKKK